MTAAFAKVVSKLAKEVAKDQLEETHLDDVEAFE